MINLYITDRAAFVRLEKLAYIEQQNWKDPQRLEDFAMSLPLMEFMVYAQ